MMISAVLWSILALVAGYQAVVEQGYLAIIIAVVAVGVSIWFWRSYVMAKRRPREKQLRTSKRRR
jgi:membrane protein implicated in regulation of membrane protease activity